MRTEIVYEVIAIGILTIIFLWPSYYVVSGKFPEKEIYNMMFGAFILGGSMHFVLEIAGLNKWWCQKTFT